MSPNARKLLTAVTTAGIIGMSLTNNPVSHAFGFDNMMNPSNWMGNGRNGDYYDGPYTGPWGAPYGGGPWGGGPYGGGPWGGRPWGGGYGPGPYGAGPYGLPRYRGAVPSAPAAKAPSQAATRNHEIDELKKRIKELESRQQPAAPPATDPGPTPPPTGWNATPTFRPLDKQ